MPFFIDPGMTQLARQVTWAGEHLMAKKSPEYQELKRILPNKTILHYTTSLGNKELLDENDKAVCNIMGTDMKLDL